MHHINLNTKIEQLLLELNAERIIITDESHLHLGHSPNAGTVIDQNSKGTHIRLVVVSQKFGGKSRVARHKMIYQLLNSLLDNPIHALALKIYTPQEYDIAHPLKG